MSRDSHEILENFESLGFLWMKMQQWINKRVETHSPYGLHDFAIFLLSGQSVGHEVSRKFSAEID